VSDSVILIQLDHFSLQTSEFDVKRYPVSSEQQAAE
jgi:hypothetical protein